MQEEINNRTIALSIRTGEVGARMTTSLLKTATHKFVVEYEKNKAKKPDHKVGKQSVKSLVRQNKELANIEITEGNIKSFERIARKYGIDFSLKKDMSSEKSHYIVFFKARDIDVITTAFKEYSAKSMNKDKEPTFKQLLESLKEQSRKLSKNRQRVRERNRGRNL